MPESSLIASQWDETTATTFDPVDLLVYASNLLGGDLRITNFGGGNTSSKVSALDQITGESKQTLWVKASGGDLGSAKRANFASLDQERVVAIARLHKEGLHEDAIVDLYKHCIVGANPAAPSIDTPLHAFVPFPCVSHMHSDAVIAIAACDRAEELTKTIWGGTMGFLPWKRPGFELGLMLRDLIAANPEVKGALMQSHGFICWADDWKACYELTLDMINQAQAYIDTQGRSEPFGAVVPTSATIDMIDLLPRLRGKVAYEGKGLIAAIDTDLVTMDFLSRANLRKLAAMGTSCPDHFLRTKIRPLVLDNLPNVEGLDRYLDTELANFRSEYQAYYERCKEPDSPAIRNPNPSVVLVPGLGMISFGKDFNEAKVTGQFYRNAIEVMRGAEAVGNYTALPEKEAFNIEYWQLEEAKLRRMPPEKEFSRKVAVVTGGAQGIGKATAQTLAERGACVILLDINQAALAQSVAEIAAIPGAKGSVAGIACDVTNPKAVESAVAQAALRYGGIDLAVIGAGNARRGKVHETELDDYDFLSDLLMRGYYLASKHIIQILLKQNTGGSLVFVASKNGTAVGSNAAIYSAAKAFELHLMRTIAVDYASQGIRANAINPDAVLTGSAIWSDQWRTETAAILGVEPDQLEEHYRKRSLLGVPVSTQDCANAIAFLLSDHQSSRTTGCTVPVDGGNREGILR